MAYWPTYRQYLVQPIIMFPADKPIDAAYHYGVKSAFEDVRRWFWTTLGRTFYLNRPYIFRCPKPDAQISPLDLVPQLTAAANLCWGIDNPKKLYYLVACTDKVAWGGTYGGTVFPRVWPPDARENCTFTYPGRCFMSQDGPRLLAGYKPLGTDAMYQRTANAQRGGIAHEIVHALGEDFHAQGWPDDDITYAWWNWPNVGFNEQTRELLLTGETSRKFLK